MSALKWYPAFLLLVSSVIAQDHPASLSGRFNREVPVRLYEGLEAKIGVRGEGVLECYRGIKLSEIYYFCDKVNIAYRDNGIELSDANGVLAFGIAEIRCKPRQQSSFITLEDRAYRGYLRCRFLEAPMGIEVLNIVDIEDYLKGVLPAEIGDRAPDEYEAVKAQAIAARTYAVWRLTEFPAGLSPTVADQVYNGLDSEKEFLSQGVDDTRGEIMVYRRHPVAAYFHAVCGGHTTTVEKTWPEKQGRPYLQPVDDRDYCAWAKTYSWTEIFSAAQLKESLETYFTSQNHARPGDFDAIRDIRFIAGKDGGRIRTMVVSTVRGEFRESYDRIRWALGQPSAPGTILLSTCFNALKEVHDDRVVSLKLIGHGNGHGVGMCQCGAIGQARAGKKYDDILKYYYKHIKLTRLY